MAEHPLGAMIGQVLFSPAPKPKRRKADPRERALKRLLAEMATVATEVLGEPELGYQVAVLASRLPSVMVKVMLGDAKAIRQLAEVAANMAEPPRPLSVDEMLPVAQEALRIIREIKAKGGPR